MMTLGRRRGARGDHQGVQEGRSRARLGEFLLRRASHLPTLGHVPRRGAVRRGGVCFGATSNPESRL